MTRQQRVHAAIASADLVEAALAAATTEDCVVVVEEQSHSYLRWAGNSLTTNGLTNSRSLTVISFDRRSTGTGVGIATRPVAGLAEARALVRAADLASRTCDPVAEACPLVESGPTDDAWADSAPETGPHVFADLVAALASGFEDAGRNERRLFGYAEHLLTTYYLGTSTGVRARHVQPDGRVELTARSAVSPNSSWCGLHVPDFATFDPAGLVAAAGRGLDWSKREIRLPPGAYETLLPPAAVADLMVFAYQRASARAANDGRTVFSAIRAGEPLSRLPLTLYSDPSYDGLRCAPVGIVTGGETDLRSVFDNGRPLTRTNWMDAGRLSQLVRTGPSAWHNDTEASPMIDNLILAGGGGETLDQMIEATERGLLLTSLWYIREVDPRTLLLTGITRDGVYLIEGGEVVGAVNNFRFNESPIDLLRRTTEAGRTENAMPRERAEAFRRTAMPPLRIPDFLMSTVSDAF